MAQASTYKEYKELCVVVDKAEGNLAWRDEERDLPQVRARQAARVTERH